MPITESDKYMQMEELLEQVKQLIHVYENVSRTQHEMQALLIERNFAVSAELATIKMKIEVIEEKLLGL